MTSFTVFKNRTSIFLPADVFLLLEAAGQDVCNKEKSKSDVLHQNISNTGRVDKDGSCLCLSPAESQASTLLDHRNLGMLSLFLLLF